MQASGEERTAKLSEAETTLLEDGYVMPLYQQTISYHQRYCEGIRLEHSAKWNVLVCEAGKTNSYYIGLYNKKAEVFPAFFVILKKKMLW